jgi:hypothetical protein
VGTREGDVPLIHADQPRVYWQETGSRGAGVAFACREQPGA